MVYVDSTGTWFRNMRMYHLVADTTDELLAMADLIGLSREYRQYAGTPKEHFDVSASKRLLALKHGAIAVDSKTIVQVIRRKRLNQGFLPTGN